MAAIDEIFDAFTGALDGRNVVVVELPKGAVAIEVSVGNDGPADGNVISLELQEMAEGPGGVPVLKVLVAPQAPPSAARKKLDMMIGSYGLRMPICNR